MALSEFSCDDYKRCYYAETEDSGRDHTPPAYVSEKVSAKQICKEDR